MSLLQVEKIFEALLAFTRFEPLLENVDLLSKKELLDEEVNLIEASPSSFYVCACISP